MKRFPHFLRRTHGPNCPKPTRMIFWTVGPLALLFGACKEIPRHYSTRESAEDRLLYSTDFSGDSSDPSGSDLGSDWHTTGPGAAIVDGHLRLKGLKNHPVWLKVPLPDNFRLEFDAWSNSEEGDIKFEIAGDGVSYAKTVSYTATGYVLIFGGWDNKLNVIARQNEHGSDRIEATKPKVEVGRQYHMEVIRRGKEIQWKLDGAPFMSMEDDSPLRGPKHRFFAFNNWEAETHFDNLKIEDLGSS